MAAKQLLEMRIHKFNSQTDGKFFFTPMKNYQITKVLWNQIFEVQHI